MGIDLGFFEKTEFEDQSTGSGKLGYSYDNAAVYFFYEGTKKCKHYDLETGRQNLVNKKLLNT